MNIKHRIFIGLGALTIFAIACIKEQTPAGLILTESVLFNDSTYSIGTIPTPQTKTILIEEATGVHCVNCPAGANEIQQFKNQNPNRILSVAVYSDGFNDFQAPSKYDFKSQDANDLVKYLGGDPPKPSAAINRSLKGANDYFYYRSEWSTAINNFISQTTPVNIDFSTSEANNLLSVITKITFTESVNTPLSISLFLIEDGVIDLQDSSGKVIEDYEHNHILRKIITPVSGSTFFENNVTISKGTVLERKFYNIKLPINILNKVNCKLVCFISKVGNKEIIHAKEIDLL